MKTILLQNFESHKETCLDLSPGVNVIIGESDSGKSSIIRALKWLCFNKPLGDEFMSNWGSGDTKVVIKIDGHVINRVKGKSNTYSIDDHVFSSFGTSPPDEVHKLINLESLNTQFQFDSPFLLSLTPGELSRYLNEIVHLDVIDLALSKINGKKRDIANKTGYLEIEAKKLSEEIQQYHWIDKAEKQVSVIDQICKEKELLQNRISRLKQIQLELTQSLDDLKKRPLIDRIKKLLSINTTRIDTLKIVRDKHTKLKKIQQQLQEEQRTISSSKAELSRVQGYYKTALSDRCPLCLQPIITQEKSCL